MTTRIVSQNSIVAYHALEDLHERQAVVYGIVKECPNISAPELFRIMRSRGYTVQENSVSPRLAELVTDGRIRVSGKKINRRTGRTVSMYEVVA